MSTHKAPTILICGVCLGAFVPFLIALPFIGYSGTAFNIALGIDIGLIVLSLLVASYLYQRRKTRQLAEEAQKEALSKSSKKQSGFQKKSREVLSFRNIDSLSEEELQEILSDTSSDSTLEIDLNNLHIDFEEGNCEICKLELRKNQQIVQCPECYALFHLDHLRAWLNVYDRCPRCGLGLIE